MSRTPPPIVSRGPARRHLSVNITTAERVGRVVLGLGAMISAIVLLTSAGSMVAVVLEPSKFRNGRAALRDRADQGALQ